MAEKDAKDGKQQRPQTVTDEQIVTTTKFPRRSFLTATGALLAGAVAVASGMRASAQEQDPDKKKPTDPDTADKKKSDPDKKKAADKDQTDKKKKVKAKSKATDPDKKKASDPDKKKATDPDKKPTDPDGYRR